MTGAIRLSEAEHWAIDRENRKAPARAAGERTEEMLGRIASLEDSLFIATALLQSALEEALRDAPVVIAGSKGQERPNPLFAEVRSHRLAFKGLLVAVGLTDAEADRNAGAARSAAGRSLARQRWSQHGATA